MGVASPYLSVRPRPSSASRHACPPSAKFRHSRGSALRGRRGFGVIVASDASTARQRLACRSMLGRAWRAAAIVRIHLTAKNLADRGESLPTAPGASC